MIRVVLAVTAATVLVAAALPAVDAARIERTDHLLDRELDELETAIEEVAARDGPVPRGVPGTRIVVTLTLPESTWTTAPVSLRIDGGDERGRRVQYRLAGGPPRRLAIGDDFATPDGAIAVTEPGTHRFVVGFERLEGRATATVRVAPPE